MTFAILSLVSCGKYATDKDLSKLKGRVSTLEEQVEKLRDQVDANVYSMGGLYADFMTSESSISALKEEMEQADETLAQDLQNAIYDATSSQNSLLAMIETLQEQTTSLLAKQAALELEDRIISVFDPCPSVSSTSYKESLFRTSSGKTVAYFEDGGKRFLTVLKTNTVYRTTDSRSCTFTL